MRFEKEFLENAIYCAVEDTITGHRRWSVDHRAVFEHEGKFCETTYSVGATESQDERPYQYDQDEIECAEVRKVAKTVEVWERVPSAEKR